jgi:hypothetical protein
MCCGELCRRDAPDGAVWAYFEALQRRGQSVHRLDKPCVIAP